LLGLGLSRRWECALLGILAVPVVGLLCWGAGYPPFVLILFGVSSILPAAPIGSLIIAKKFVQRTFGIIFLVMYIVLWIAFSYYLTMLID
jgi:hypothetical protein